jgi:hypothetical protein
LFSWRGYQNLEKLGLRHTRVNHSKRNQNQLFRKIHSNTIEGTWNSIKMNLKVRNSNKNIIQKHLHEFSYRRKHHNNLWESLLNILKQQIN